MDEVKFHPFFKKIDWQKLEQKKISPPFLPHVYINSFRLSKKIILTTNSAFLKTLRFRIWRSTK